MHSVPMLRTSLARLKKDQSKNSWTPMFMGTNKGVILWLFELGKAKEQ